MANTDAKIAEQVQKAYTSALITMFQLDLSHLDVGTICFTQGNAEMDAPVTFNGVQYAAWPIDADGFERTASGSAARPTLTVYTHTPEMISLLMTESLQGAKLTRIRTFRDFLDDGADPSPTSTLPIDVYRVECVKEWNSNSHAVIELANPLDLENALFPKRQIMKDYCYWRYRAWNSVTQRFIYNPVAPCPYTGTKYFNRKNEATTADKDQCSCTLTGCKLRFGEHAILPFGGFPGVGKVSGYGY